MSRRLPHLRRKLLVPSARPGPRDRGYTVGWERRRAAYLRDHPLCERCGRAGADMVDHKVALRRGGRDDEGNYQALCNACHSEKSLAYDGWLGRPLKPYPTTPDAPTGAPGREDTPAADGGPATSG